MKRYKVSAWTRIKWFVRGLVDWDKEFGILTINLPFDYALQMQGSVVFGKRV